MSASSDVFFAGGAGRPRSPCAYVLPHRRRGAPMPHRSLPQNPHRINRYSWESYILSLDGDCADRARPCAWLPTADGPTTLRFVIALVWEGGRWSLGGTDPTASMHHFTCACSCQISALGMSELLDQQRGRRNKPWNRHNSENLTEGKISSC